MGQHRRIRASIRRAGGAFVAATLIVGVVAVPRAAVALPVPEPLPAPLPIEITPGSGATAGSVNYDWPGIPTVGERPTRFLLSATWAGSLVIGDRVWAGTAAVYAIGASSSPGESFDRGTGTVSSGLFEGTGVVGADSGYLRLTTMPTGTFARHLTTLRLTMTADLELCAGAVCETAPVEITFAVVYDPSRLSGCYGGCMMNGALTVRPAGDNHAPGTTVLVSPPPAHEFSGEQPQVFSVRATDADGDPYVAAVTVRNRDNGDLVTTFDLPPAMSGEVATGTVPRSLPIGRYTWSAQSVDPGGRYGPATLARPFDVGALPIPDTSPLPSNGPTIRLSVATSRAEGSDDSSDPSASADGRYVAFVSEATDLVPDDANGVRDVFVRDRASGNTERVSISSSEVQGNQQSGEPSISGDGRYIAFFSWATNLVSGDTNARPDIFVHDRETSTTTKVSNGLSGAPAEDGSWGPSISANGRYVAFESMANNLAGNDAPRPVYSPRDVFRHDRQTGTTELISVSSSEVQGDDFAWEAQISADGDHVAFSSSAMNLAPGFVFNGWQQVYVRDVTSGTTWRVSLSPGGSPSDNASTDPQISSDGRYVAFRSNATNLGVSYVGMPGQIWVRDRIAESTTLASRTNDGTPVDGSANNPSLSGNGRFVAFDTNAPNLHGGSASTINVFVHDMQTVTTANASISSWGGSGNHMSSDASLSTNGRYIAFWSRADNLVSDDNNLVDDVFHRDRVGDDPCEGQVGVGTPQGCAGVNRASSDLVGLEDFYPYEPWQVGSDGVAFVNLATGNLVAHYADVAAPGHGLSMRVTRTYNAARDAVDGPLGRGWSLGVADADGKDTLLGELDTILTTLDLSRAAELLGTDDSFDFYDGDGTRHHFVKDGFEGPGWHAPPGIGLTLADLVDSRGHRWYRATRPDGVVYEFRLVGVDYRLTKISDRSLNELTFAYSSGKLSTVTDSNGRTIEVTWSGSYIDKVTFRAGTDTYVVDYTVTSGRLMSVTEAFGTTAARTTSYVYGSPAGLSSIKDARLNSTTFTTTDGRVTKVADRAEEDWTLTWGGDTCMPLSGFGATAVCITDPAGNTRTKTISAAGNLIHERDAGDADAANQPRRNDRAYVWGGNRLRQAIDEVGNVTEYEYDDLGMTIATRATGPNESRVVNEYAYARPQAGVADLVEARINTGSGDQRTWVFERDPAGKGWLTSVRNPMNETTSFGYVGRGLLSSVTMPWGAAIKYGNTTAPAYGYHSTGQPLTITDAGNKTTTFEYDFLGRQKKRVDRTNQTWLQEWDARGNLTRAIDPEGDATLTCYDPNDNPWLVVSPRSLAPSCSLDGTDGFSKKAWFDDRDLVEKTLGVSDGQYRKTMYLYTDDGALRAIQEPRHFNTTNASFTDLVAPGQRVDYLLYPNRRLRAFKNERGVQTDFTHTPNGFIASVTHPSSGAPERRRETFTYNRRGQILTHIDSGRSGPLTHTYNDHGDVIRTTDRMSHTTVFGYDKMGRPTTTTNAAGHISTRTYDAFGRLFEVSQPRGTGGTLVRRYGWNARGQLDFELEPAADRRIVYGYDNEGRQTTRTEHQAGQVVRVSEQTWEVDGEKSEEIARFPSGTAGMHRLKYQYDDAGNVAEVNTYRDGALDAAPNVSTFIVGYTSQDEPKQVTETVYGSGGPKTVISSYGWGADGLLVRRTVDGLATNYGRRTSGEVSSIAPWGGPAWTMTHHDSGQVATTTLPNLASVTQTYDMADRVSSRVVRSTNSENAPVLAAWEGVRYDANDNRASEIVSMLKPGEAGPPVPKSASYSYDELDRLEFARLPDQTSGSRYVLDDAGNVLSDAKWRYQYDEANRLVRKDPNRFVFENPHAYEYNRTGDLAKDRLDVVDGEAVTYGYDAASHATALTTEDGSTVTYRYGVGERVTERIFDGAPPSEPTPSECEPFPDEPLPPLCDPEAGPVDLVSIGTLFFHDWLTGETVLEMDRFGAVQTRYVLDADGTPVAQDTPGTAKRGYYVTDMRRNLAMILDSARQVKATFAYDPFGANDPRGTSVTAGWDSRLRYQLAPREPKIDAYNLGPRLLQPSINRFLGADYYASAAGNLELQLDPLTANRYLYAGANPANLVDDGHDPSRYHYSLTWKIGRGSPGQAEFLMRIVMAVPDDFFPFTVEGGSISRGRKLHLYGQYDIGYVTVVGVGHNWFTFATHKGHVEGFPAWVQFQIYSYKGDLYFRVDATGPNGFWGRLPLFNRGRKFIARDLWSGFVANLRGVWSYLCSVAPPGSCR